MMRDYLLFRLYGPLASWGHIAVGEERSTDNRPTRSGVLGLLAAALGLRRGDEDRLNALDRSLGFSVRTESMGLRLTDFHTVQIPRAFKGVRHETRYEEVAALDPQKDTIVSRREYLMDAFSTVCLWQRPEAEGFFLADLAEALRRPVFTLYLGRKSCPPALPVFPLLVKAESILQALSQASFPDDDLTRTLFEPGQGSLFWDADGISGIDPSHRFTRRDKPAGWTRRQFSERHEFFAGLGGREV